MDKQIVCGLHEIQRAIDELAQYRKELKKTVKELVTKLAETGAEIARAEVLRLEAVETGELLGSIKGYYDEKEKCGIVVADAAYAVFVEYGTGVVGAENPHPKPPDGWKHSNRPDGWWYIDPKSGKKRWTKGQGARPFMYRTAQELRRMTGQ